MISFNLKNNNTMNIPYNTQDNDKPITIIQYSTFPPGTKERETLELYIISKAADLVTMELTTREKIPVELN